MMPCVEAWVVCDHKAIRRFGLGALGPAPMRIKPFLGSGYIKRGETRGGPGGGLRHRS